MFCGVLGASDFRAPVFSKLVVAIPATEVQTNKVPMVKTTAFFKIVLLIEIFLPPVQTIAI